MRGPKRFLPPPAISHESKPLSLTREVFQCCHFPRRCHECPSHVRKFADVKLYDHVKLLVGGGDARQQVAPIGRAGHLPIVTASPRASLRISCRYLCSRGPFVTNFQHGWSSVLRFTVGSSGKAVFLLYLLTVLTRKPARPRSSQNLMTSV